VEPLAAGPDAVPARRRPRLGRILTAGLVAVAVVAGVGYTSVTVSHADRDPGKPVWKLPKATKDAGDPQAKGLRGMLLPYEQAVNGYHQGPDIGEYGADAELNGAQATALRKQSIHDLPPTTRRKLEDEIDKQHIKGMAMRSYASPGVGSGDGKHAATIGVELVQMDSGSARHLASTQQQFFAALQIFRKGPEIKGHKNAACFLTPKSDGEKFDRMFCSAYVGNVLVSVHVTGARPVDGNALALFVGQQLDRIKDPGKAV
jgi:hypothetical protein